MTENIISVEKLSKRYFIGHRRELARQATLRDVITGGVQNAVRKISDLARGHYTHANTNEEFWALKDVSFQVKRGEVLGIIGRNGAGKSTLLKVLSRITEPTDGRVRIRGRVASLLEVGTGFHPELSGRENIYLNGAILGMRRAEIRRKFDEIVAFAEVEKFLDTPVKRYSSGMYVRLAFAVAAHLEPEILIIDEVLAVGDTAFQAKCLGKMRDVAGHGRTVLFVSHTMSAVNRLCGRCLLLEGGVVAAAGETQSVTSHYLMLDSGGMASRRWDDPESRPGDKVSQLLNVCVKQNNQIVDTIDIRLPVELEMVYEVYRDDAQLLCGFSFFDSLGVHLFGSADLNDPVSAYPRARGTYKSTCIVPGNLFAEGLVRVASEVATRHPFYEIHFLVHDSVTFQVVDSGEPGSVRGSWARPIPGVMRPMCEWRTTSRTAVRETDNTFERGRNELFPHSH